MDHVFPLKDGTGLWATGYWELSDYEREMIKHVFLHKTKAMSSHWGGEVREIVAASKFAEKAKEHLTDPAGRWVLIVQPDSSARDVAWEGASHSMAYKSLV